MTCRMISVDRTMRNKEALKRLDTINNSGAINASGVASVVYKTYFDFNNVLSKTEVYPDLELPTIDELEQCGFKYIQYSFNKGSITSAICLSANVIFKNPFFNTNIAEFSLIFKTIKFRS